MTVEDSSPMVDPALFRHVVGHLASGVCVVTTADGGVPAGMTASSVTSLSLDPPLMLVCINQAAPMSQAVRRTGRFAVNVLGDGAEWLARQFATPAPDKFRNVPLRAGSAGLPLIEEAIAHIECRVEEFYPGGTHLVFVGRVVGATAATGAEPLAYFRGQFGRLHFARDDAAYTLVRHQVLNRAYPPDTALDPAAIATGLELDQSAVFYALTRLSQDGLVARDPARGYVVVPFDVALAERVFEARCALQIGAVHLGSPHGGDDRVQNLGGWLAEMARTIQGDRFRDFDRYLDANYEFHLGIVRLAENPTLEASFSGLDVKTIMARAFGATDETSTSFLQAQEDIFTALVEGDVERCSRAIMAYTVMAKHRAREVLGGLGGPL